MKRPKKRPEGLKPVSFGSDDNGSKASSKSNSSGGKGGGKSVNPSTSKGQKAITASRTKKSGFGYYNDAGKYVPAYIDAFDGGGMNQQGTYFAGGPLSNILNVAKVAPLGATEGLVPREEIGYRDLTDMFDQGGPQASGGGFRGAGGFSGLGNIANMLAGNESERVGYYDEGGRFYEPPAAPASSGVLGSGQSNDVPLQNYESTGRQMQTMGLPNYESTGRQMLQMVQGPRDYRSQYVSEAVSDAYNREMSQAEALGISPEEADARYYAQKHMAYPHLEMEYLTDPEDGYAGIPNIERLMPPTSAPPQASQGIPVQPYQAKQVPPSLQLDPIPKYAETMERMRQELGEEKFNEILMSPNATQLIDLYELGGPFKL
jgi:hypothetical protein